MKTIDTPMSIGSAAKHQGEQARGKHHQQQGGDEAVTEVPMPGQGFPIEEHHEVRQFGFVIAVQADLAHQVHAHGIATQRKKQSMAQ